MNYSDTFNLSTMTENEKISFLRENINYLIAKNVFESLKTVLKLKNYSNIELWQYQDDEFISFTIEFPDDLGSGQDPNSIMNELNIPEIEDLTFGPLMKSDFHFYKDMTFETFLSYLNI